jgi:hypothetical protein
MIIVVDVVDAVVVVVVVIIVIVIIIVGTNNGIGFLKRVQDERQRLKIRVMLDTEGSGR